jgi:hypothetical protein
MAKDINLIWVSDGAEYFYKKGWTGISDLPAGQPGWVERRAIQPSCPPTQTFKSNARPMTSFAYCAELSDYAVANPPSALLS